MKFTQGISTEEYNDFPMISHELLSHISSILRAMFSSCRTIFSVAAVASLFSFSIFMSLNYDIFIKNFFVKDIFVKGFFILLIQI